MKKIDINISVEHYANLRELSDTDRELVEKAISATDLSYNKYSNFAVGACLRLKDGSLVQGANQENAAYTVTICAERTALDSAAVQHPGIAPVAIAIAAKNKNELTSHPVSPCGVCRQALNEYEVRYEQPIRILLYGTEGIYAVNSIKDLLPLSFDEF